MSTPGHRTKDQIRTDLAGEREGLAAAVEQLRTEAGAAAGKAKRVVPLAVAGVTALRVLRAVLKRR